MFYQKIHEFIALLKEKIIKQEINNSVEVEQTKMKEIYASCNEAEKEMLRTITDRYLLQFCSVPPPSIRKINFEALRQI